MEKENSEVMIKNFRMVIVEPAAPHVLNVIGRMYTEAGSLLDGLSWINRSITADPRTLQYSVHKSIVYQRLGHFDESRALLHEILKINPYFESALINLAHTEKDRKEFLAATDAYEKVLVLRPDVFPPYEHLSFCYPYPGRLSDRIRALERARIIAPNIPDIEYQLGLFYLMTGRFDLGWDLLDFRWNVTHVMSSDNYSKRLAFNRPAFNPEEYREPIFIWAEQGLGDEIMFLSLLEEFCQFFTKSVIVQVDPRMIEIWQRSFPEIHFIGRNMNLDESEFGTHLPAGDLPKLFRRTREKFVPREGGFLKADDSRVKNLLKSIKIKDYLIVGLSWHSVNGNNRCIALRDLLTALNLPGVVFVNLQYGDRGEEIAEAEIELGRAVFSEIDVDLQSDLEGVAALIRCCDLVVSIANSTAHLAGALGVPTVTLLPFFPGWRWLTEGEQSLWYRSVRLVRQEVSGDWTSTLLVVKKIVADRLTQRDRPH